MAKINGNKKLRVASLFCGCGGMDLGIQGDFSYLGKHFESLPFEVVYAADNDLYATNIYNSNFSHKCELKDVRDIVPSEVPDHDILLGGFPCQSFSIIAQNPQRLGYKDERGKLFFEMVNVLKEKQPRFFIGENVKGLLSANEGKAFPMIIKEFEKAGYHIHHKLLNASEFGVPQKRERVFIVGFREFDDYFNFRFPLPNTLNGAKVKLKQVIDKKANKDDKWFFSQRAVDGMLRVREKMNKGRVQDLEQPCNTISSHLAKVSLNGTDPVLMIDERYRRLTPREAARIQSFPETFTLDTVSENRQYRAIGNAVPPVLMWQVANALTKSLLTDTPIKVKERKNILTEA
ncbi:MAG: DNA cytosine methyltransferase [Chitinophagaceae bacterium]|jgi:DNA (cytosine-5)-methyltransferase 1|nr:DNA cytosine methyltransferase [Chitinophagaceae bacterium]MBP8993090.1 DNA cytosine methyltransferase [Bacteroidales bacterium]MBK7088412.1 DNA cytosine methyltransferase [Chitinophagaceae bacterium]MBK7348225.1 DNA cytosine methyltransferase [Chitinophagaceae bacterium]MBK8775809.1 DNA cytosine methyltransferase [Chitinophagaceae bacterium]